MANMTDQNRVNALLNWMFNGGGAPTITSPYHQRLLTANGSNTSNGTESTSGNCPGYTAGGVTMGSPSFGAASAGVVANSNIQSWAATGSWSTITGTEIWDTAGTPLRWLQGALTSNITGVSNGDTVQFAAASISANASQW